MKQKDLIIRVDPIFKKELDEIKLMKIKVGTSKFMASDRRITKAIRRMDDWTVIKQRLIQADFEDDRRKKE